MGNNFVFSWAEDAQGKMVHVDDVPRGLACGCVCPYCREKLLARHGDIKEHGFAHHSDNRGLIWIFATWLYCTSLRSK